MKKRLYLLLSIFTMMVSGVFSQIHSKKYNEATNVINWPAEFNPKKSKFFVYNAIEINASPEVIWDILIDAEKWPEWYVGAKEVKVLDSVIKKLNLNTSFSWQTMGFKFTSVIKEFIPNSRLSWQSFKKGIPGYHAWVIIPVANGCKVITAESQNGWITIPEKIFQPKKLIKLHDIWLQEIKKKAEIKSQVASSGISTELTTLKNLALPEHAFLIRKLVSTIGNLTNTVANLNGNQFFLRSESDKCTNAECIEHLPNYVSLKMK